MSTLDLGVLILTLITAAVGSWSIHWAKADPQSRRCRGGRILFVANLLTVGAVGLVAAFTRTPGLPPLGLVAGLLIVGMMWEGPEANPRRTPPRRAPSRTPPVPPDGQST